MTITRDDGVVIDVELLRPDQWILDHSVFVGSELPIHVAELDVDGTATVTALSACPGLAAGDGECVTGRFVTRQVAETIRITLADGTLLEGTPVHPIWSVDRADFIALGELQPGERLQTATGPQAIASAEIRHLPVPVYNIEVRGQHVYEVTDAGILVHNAQPCLVDVNDPTDPAITEFSVRPLGSFSAPGAKGDGLSGHELLQGAWLRKHANAGRSPSLGRQNPAVALAESTHHKQISKLQAEAGLHSPRIIAAQSATQNILENVQILKEAEVPREAILELLVKTRSFIQEVGI